MIRGQDYSNGWVEPDELFRVSASIEKVYKNARVKSGDILITIVGASTGRIAVVPHWLDGANLTQTTARISIIHSAAVSRFCGYVLASSYGTNQTVNYMKGGAQPGLNCGDVEKFLIPLPPTRKEQDAIAESLSDADALILSLEALIAKRRAIKQGAMQDLLSGRKRLPGFSGKWNTRLLSELCALKSGDGITSKQIDSFSPYPCYGGNGLRGRTTTYTHEGRYALIGRVGALCGNINVADGRFFASEHAIVVTASESTSIDWLALVLDDLRLNRLSEASAQPVLTVSKLAKLEIFGPTEKSEQNAIATLIADIDADLVALGDRLSKAHQIKQGMMQELLTGRVRLV
jgi:type I restriction enzyme S subunit